MLYPVFNSHRGFIDLCGIWDFKIDTESNGEAAGWFRAPLATPLPMPVPASYNDIGQDPALRDHIGDVWYQRTLCVPIQMSAGRYELRFDAVAHHAVVWLDEQRLGEHQGGFLPFVFDVTTLIRPGQLHRITVKVGNILDWKTFPPGEIRKPRDIENYPPGYRWQETHFDFFNYAGIFRPVRLVMTPETRIEKIKVITGFDETSGWVDYSININKKSNVRIALRNHEGQEIACRSTTEGRLLVAAPRLWSPNDPYLYQLECQLVDADGSILDIYTERIGIRTVAVVGSKLLLNGTPIYLKGFGRHEDADVRGRGLDLTLLVKDHNLMEWIGANSYRTSHYPYSEEAMRMADERGLLIIDEVPAVGFNTWRHDPVVYVPERANDATLAAHLHTLSALIERDQNHPSVIIWSVANEAATWEPGAVPYFEKVCAHVRQLDSTRPVMIVEAGRAIAEPDRMPASLVTHLVDIVGINRYYGWYNDPGRLDLMRHQLERELRLWWSQHHKPILLAEYGADAVDGLHSNPPQMFTEEYQAESLARVHEAIDSVDFVIGEHVWNFADFATKQAPGRIFGNRKGVFTRNRHPKQAASLLRKRWHGAKDNR
ncbi:MAG: hypothetical protein RL376_240 [Verrucomicrobiota bacterium]|jgi:beta-glucuronidase